MAARKEMPGVIRKICLWCQGGSWRGVRDCALGSCPLHPCRLVEDGDDALLQGCIAEFCLACAGGAEAVAECGADRPMGVQPPCPAHPYRLAGPVQPDGVPQNSEPCVPAQQIRPLPGLGEFRQRLSPEGAPVAAPPTPPVQHEALTVMHAERAPEALDI
jgi:hypothetical protein